MKVTCVPASHPLLSQDVAALRVLLYGRAHGSEFGSVGASVKEAILHEKFRVEPRAWDLLSIALSVIAADTACLRNESPDGWTREIELEIAVDEPDFWRGQKALLEKQLRFLTTDIWSVDFAGGSAPLEARTECEAPEADCVVLLSGGLDSLTGALDLTNAGCIPLAVSQITRGDGERQRLFAAQIAGGLRHLQLNHNAECPGLTERSQRARSFLFLAYGVVVGTALRRYHERGDSTLYVCENGFISINPPLTESRLGSLSTRTTHPVFLKLFRQLLEAADLRVMVENPYQFNTKGEMLKNCAAQETLRANAHMTNSCGRFARNGYKHCGRCLPCLIRRAAFTRWGVHDQTEYVFTNLGTDDEDHVGYDDVRAAAMAVAEMESEGINTWLGTKLNSVQLGCDVSDYREVVQRGLVELGEFLRVEGVL